MKDMAVDVEKLENLCESAELILANQMSKLAVDNRYGFDAINSIYSSIPSLKESLFRTVILLAAFAKDYNFNKNQTPDTRNQSWSDFEMLWLHRQQRNKDMSVITISSSSETDSDSDFITRPVQVEERTHFTRGLLSAPEQYCRNIQRRPLEMEKLRELLIEDGPFTSTFEWKYGLTHLHPESVWPKGIKPATKLCFIWMPLILSALDRITNKEASNIFFKLPKSPILEIIIEKFTTYLENPEVKFYVADIDCRSHLTVSSMDQLISRLPGPDLQQLLDYVEDQIGKVS
jgi:hypothetical protein